MIYETEISLVKETNRGVFQKGKNQIINSSNIEFFL